MLRWPTLLTLLVQLPLLAQDPIHRRYTTVDGLPSDLIYCAFQDRDGFLWFGTEVGVSRFDGHRFVNYFLKDGLSDNNVLVIEQDSMGRIWFLTLNGRLCFWLDGRIYNDKDYPDLARYTSRSGFQSFAEDKDGLLWFGAILHDLVRIDLDGERDTLLKTPYGHMDVFAGTNGQVLCSVGESLGRLVDAKLELLYETGPLGGPAQGNVRGGVATGILYGSAKRGAPAVVANAEQFFEVDHSGMRCVLRDPDIIGLGHTGSWRDAGGHLWIRRAEGGAVRWPALPKGGFEPAEQFFPRDLVNKVVLDRHGNYWFATRGDGVILVERADIGTHLYPLRVGRPVAASTLHMDQDGSLLIGTADGRILRGNGLGQELQEVLGSSLSLGRVRAFSSAEHDGTLVATDRDALYLSRAGKHRKIGALLEGRRADILQPHYGAKTVVRGPSGRYWLPYLGIFTLASIDDQARMRMDLGAYKRDRIYALQEDAQGVLWFGTGNSVVRYDGRTAAQVTALEGRCGLRITCMQRIHGDTLLIGTMGNGVQVVHDGVPLDEWTLADGLVSDEVTNLRVMGDTVLVCCTGGLSMIRFKDGTMGPLRTWTTSTGLPFAELNDAALARGRLFVAGSRGLCDLPLDRLPLFHEPPVVYFSRVALNDSAIAGPPEPVQLRQESDRLSVSFSTINFNEPEADVYQYRLNERMAWVKTATGVLELSELEPGSYRLEVRGRTAFSDWSVPIGLSFTVRPVWWRTGVALAGAVALVLSALFVMLYYLSRRRDRHRLALLREQAVVNEERRRIAADVHDDLGADLSRLMLYAGKGDGNGKMEEKVRQGLAATIGKIDEIIWSLDPERDILSSTIHFVEQQVKEMTDAAGIGFRTRVILPKDELPMPASLRRAIMLVVQEAARNAVEHAHATGISLAWEAEKEGLIIRVEDDGRGFDVAAVDSERHGLRNMHARAKTIGGVLRIRSFQGQGTCIELRLPFPGITLRGDGDVGGP